MVAADHIDSSCAVVRTKITGTCWTNQARSAARLTDRQPAFHADVLGAVDELAADQNAAIYGLEDTGSVQALILELVDGETLDQRLKRGPIPLPEALTIGRQIARRDEVQRV